jgi:hypothetical protein
MTEQSPYCENPISWSQINDAIQYWRNQLAPLNPEVTGDETSAVLLIHSGWQTRQMRDWLHANFEEFSLHGIAYEEHKLYNPFAVRFRFTSFDDKLLFVLRWL